MIVKYTRSSYTIDLFQSDVIKVLLESFNWIATYVGIVLEKILIKISWYQNWIVLPINVSRRINSVNHGFAVSMIYSVTQAMIRSLSVNSDKFQPGIFSCDDGFNTNVS